MVIPNPNMMQQSQGVPIQPQRGMPVQPQRGMPVQPQRGMPVQPQRGRSIMAPRSPIEGIQDYAKMADENPSRLASAMRLAQQKGLPSVPPKELSTGIGDMASNGMALIPERSPERDFNLHRDVLKPLAKAAAAGLAMNLDSETREELKQSTEPLIEEIETEDITIDEPGISEVGRQLLGNNLPQLASNSYIGMEENEIKAAAGGGLMGLAAEDEFSGIVEGEGHGMEDNIRMPIKEEGEEVGILAVSPKEYVVDSHTMSALGNGNPDEGADIMDEFVENIREEAFGTREQPNEINGLASLQSMLERV